MRQVLYLLLTLCFSVVCSAQEVVNPFEIQSRIDSIYTSTPTTIQKSKNVFDVERKDDLVGSESDFFDDSESKEESSIQPAVGEDLPVNDKNFVEDNLNPFDVSHIPIRKSKLKKEANAFKTKAKKQKKSASSGSNAFLFWLIFISGLILAIVINTQRGALTKITRAITNENVLKLNLREEKRGVNGHYLLLYISFFINAAIFIYLIQNNIMNVSGWKVFQWALLCITSIYLVRHVFLYFLGKSFPIEKEVSLYGFTIQSFNIFLGIILIPINLIIAFGPEKIALPFIYIMAVFIGFILLLRSLRGILIASRYVSGNLFHFLLYLCTFEILPILLLLKVLGNFEIA